MTTERRVRAAVLREHGGAPGLEQRPEPVAAEGSVLVDVQAAPITPLDVLCASGTSYFGAPPLPYVPGVQGVGTRRDDGQAVWFATSAGMQPGDGSLAETVAVPVADVVALEDDVPPALVAALGLSAVAAWSALVRTGGVQSGEQVVVLGAGGVVGQVAVQLARLHGARRVVAGCRSDAAAERASRCGADAVVRLDTADTAVLAQRFAQACDGPADLVLDPLAGAPAAAAMTVLRPDGRLVHLGSSAGPVLPVDSALLRSRSLRLLGYTNASLDPDARRTALTAVLGHAARGALTVDAEVVPLADVADAWARQRDGQATRRLVVDLSDPAQESA